MTACAGAFVEHGLYKWANKDRETLHPHSQLNEHNKYLNLIYSTWQEENAEQNIPSTEEVPKVWTENYKKFH